MIITKEVISKIDEVLARGLCVGVGQRDGQMCVEAAICYAIGEPHSDEPSCVAPAVRAFKIKLNDSPYWGTTKERAVGMRALAIAQLGSKGVVDEAAFAKRLALRTARELLPPVLKAARYTEHATRCAGAKTLEEARHAAYAAYAAAHHADAYAAYAAADAAYAAAYAAAHAADGAADAAYAAAAVAYGLYTGPAPKQYLEKSAQIALETLQQLGSPGCEWL